MLKKIIIIILLLNLAACGFKLRGSVNLPSTFNNIAIIIADSHHELEVIIKDSLQAYAKTINPNPTQADYVIIIENSFINQQVLSVSANTTPRQYQIIYTVVYSLHQHGKPIISANMITIQRQFTLNNDRVLGSNDEGSVIIKEMYLEATNQIISRISKKLSPAAS